MNIGLQHEIPGARLMVEMMENSVISLYLDMRLRKTEEYTKSDKWSN